MSKKASFRFTFPKTKLIFISVVKPDTEYNAEGTYQVSLVYSKDEAEALKAKIEKLDPSFAGLCNYRENDDGTAQFKVKQNRFVRWVDKKTNERQEQIMTPTILNADNTPYEGSEPWGGTIGEVGVVVETQAGANRRGTILALRLRGLRIHELVTGGAGAGDGDPMFGGPVANAKADEDDLDLPFDVADADVNDDDAPI
ncbi:hypothetical protein FDJ32_gp34 [Pseudomonas phage NV1]|uniref:Uncharacterized protein n=1 Tax=Pseudomonas phage NV1 TaxID=2079543 RepID=A0A2L0HPN1_9CAUD|nr:hypothetical protein FDJ32_gp34 [Pseudomonas phage NV1]AUX83663.1 hypothetical protein NV1_p34 [Pseudomonas phage NV1]